MPAQLGAGQAAKICNNMILGATMVATCEAFVLAQKLGLDPQTFFDISSKASGQSWSMTSYAPVPGVGPDTPADHDYEGGFAAALMLKDLKLAMDAAQSVGAYTPMGGEAEELFQRFVDRGGGNKDFSGNHQDDRRQLESAGRTIGETMRIPSLPPLRVRVAGRLRRLEVRPGEQRAAISARCVPTAIGRGDACQAARRSAAEGRGAEDHARAA